MHTEWSDELLAEGRPIGTAISEIAGKFDHWLKMTFTSFGERERQDCVKAYESSVKLEFALQGLDPRTPAEATAQLQVALNPGSSTDAPIDETSHNIAAGRRLHLAAPHADDVDKNDAALSTSSTSDVIPYPDWGRAEDACPVTPPPAPDARTGSDHHFEQDNRGNQTITDIWKKHPYDSFRGFRPRGEHRIDLATRNRTGQMQKGRPQPSVVYEHHTADAIHLCLYACHTVLQPVLMARHRKDKEMIKTATAAGMGKWVHMTFA